MPPESSDDSEALATYLKALANPKRLRLLHFLVRPHSIEEIATEIETARQTAQEHLQVLMDVGVVQRNRARGDHGPVSEYVVVPQRLFSIQEEFTRVGNLEVEVDDVPAAWSRTEPISGEAPRPGDAQEARLVIVRGRRVGEVTTLPGQGPWLVGREPGARVCLDYDPFVSTRHAEIRWEGREFLLADLYSSNGTSLDWRRLPRGGVVRLPEGAIVGVGKTTLVFRRG